MGNSPENLSSLRVHSPPVSVNVTGPKRPETVCPGNTKDGRTYRFHVRSQRVVDCDVQLVLTRTKMIGQVEDIRRPDAYPDEFLVDMDLRRPRTRPRSSNLRVAAWSASHVPASDDSGPRHCSRPTPAPPRSRPSLRQWPSQSVPGHPRIPPAL